MDIDRARLSILQAGLSILQKAYGMKVAEMAARRIRGLVRGLWAGEIDEPTFIESMMRAVERGVETAWRNGAAQCGISMEDLSEAERAEMERVKQETYAPVATFARQIMEGNRESGTRLRVHLQRAALWTNRFSAAFARAQQMACADKKLKWVLGRTEQHCVDCLRLAGRVYRASTWAKYNIQPQSKLLSCGGWRCDCRFEVTDEPVTPGRPPMIGR